MTLRLPPDEPIVIQVATAIRIGDVDTLQRVLREMPDLAQARVMGRRGGSRTLLHIVADWPGHFANGAASVRAIVGAGADVDAPAEGGASAETPLHWAASSDDREVAAALLDAGADIEAPGASIAGGAPLDDAVGYACWDVARLLVERGARVDRLWHAAALGMMQRLQDLLDQQPPPGPRQIDQAFWHACSGGQRRAAEFLLGRGAQIDYLPDYAKDTPLAAAGSPGTQRQLLIEFLRERGAH
jgi:ankyrin repeat protein